MNESNGDILLLAPDGVAEELSALSERVSFLHRADPYDALDELARRSYGAVILAQDYPDFAALVRAVRRLQQSARLVALCSPAGEADLKMSREDETDNYLIYPPTAAELEGIFFRPEGDTDTAAPGLETPGLPTGEIVELVEAAGSIESLLEQVVRSVGRWTGLTVRWTGDDEADEEDEPLLRLETDPPRVLLVDRSSATIRPSARASLTALQTLLDPLVAQARRSESLHRLAITDYLTGAYNRRYFYHFADQLLGRAGTNRFRVTLLLYDIDDFKRYNDAYGHAAGDDILRETAALMKQTTRRHDIVARIGGDEFAVLFWDAEPPRQPDSQHPETACVLAGRFVKALGEHEFTSLGPEARGALTISGGLASFPWDGKTCRDLLRRADKALRQAKSSGKNAIHIVGQINTALNNE